MVRGCGPCAPSAHSTRLTAEGPVRSDAVHALSKGDQRVRRPAGDAPAGCRFARPVTAISARGPREGVRRPGSGDFETAAHSRGD